MAKREMSLLARMYTKLVNAVLSRGGKEEDVRRLVSIRSRRPITSVADAIVGIRTPASNGIFTVTVDSRQSFRELAGKFHHLDRDIRREQASPPSEGQQKLELELYHPDEEILPREVVVICKKRGWRMANTWELMVFVDWYIEWIRKEKPFFPIFALGDPWRSAEKGSCGRIAVFNNYPDGRRELHSDWFDSVRNHLDRFLVVKEKQP